MNEQIKGKGAVGAAIAYYSLHGMVSIPLSPCDYNLVFEDETGKLNKIKVVSCSYKNKQGVFAVNIRSSGGNQPSTKIKTFDSKSCDFVFVLTSDLQMFSIPSDQIQSKRQICVSMYGDFKVEFIPE
jgi:hypothetical protein